ncbi:MAG: ParB/RepB/Spo0J family partition protein [Elusimicrobia bacterium]|nr:ParB/RepB/Spo0J family partition protein [Elusimicrobiota bacterium]
MAKVLGRGLDALIPIKEPQSEMERRQPTTLPIEAIQPNPYQPRTAFPETSLLELAESMRKNGVLQPIMVTPTETPGRYELIVGERRWRAAKLAGLTVIPAVIRSATAPERLHLALVENLQREDLNPLEAAKGYRRLIDDFHLTQEEVGEIVGKSRVVVANALRLLDLPAPIRQALAGGLITEGHARALAGLDDASTQETLADRVINERLTVREVEKLVADWKTVLATGGTSPRRRGRQKSTELRSLEEELQRILSRKVQISGSRKKGWVRLQYYSLDDFDQLVARLRRMTSNSNN